MGDVNQNVIFRIGSKLGPGGFASLQAGIQLLGQMSGKIIEVAKEAEKFAQVHSKLTLDIAAADRATKGLIDTMALMQNANKITNAGLNLTEQQFKDIAVVATDYAQATGQDATQAMDRLTESIAKGSTRALKELGIDLSDGADLAELQAQAIEKISAKAKDMTVEVETASERLYALGNNISTFTGLLFEAVGASDTLSGSLNALNNEFSLINEMLMEAPKAMGDYIFSFDGLKGMLIEMSAVIVDYVLAPLEMIFDLVGRGDIIASARKKVMAAPGMVGGAHRDVTFLKGTIEKKQRSREMSARKEQGLGRGLGLGRGTSGGGGVGGQEMVFSEAEAFGEMGRIQSNVDQAMADLAARGGSFSEGEIDETLLNFIGPEVVNETQLALEEQEIKIADDRLARKREEIDLENERRVQQREYLEEMTDFAGSFGDAWMNAYDQVSAGSLAAQGAMTMFKSATGAVVKAAIKGSGSMKEAMRATLEEVGTAIAIEATWRGLLETGLAIAAFAGYRYDEGAQHLAAAAVLFGTAAVAGVAAGAAARNAPKSSTSVASPSSVAQSATNTSAQEAWSPETGEKQQQVVTIHLSYNEDGILEAVKKQNDNASMSGDTHFATVTG